MRQINEDWCSHSEEWGKLLKIEAVIVKNEANYWGMSPILFSCAIVLVKIARNQSKRRNDARGTQRVNSHVCVIPSSALYIVVCWRRCEPKWDLCYSIVWRLDFCYSIVRKWLEVIPLNLRHPVLCTVYCGVLTKVFCLSVTSVIPLCEDWTSVILLKGDD